MFIKLTQYGRPLAMSIGKLVTATIEETDNGTTRIEFPNAKIYYVEESVDAIMAMINNRSADE